VLERLDVIPVRVTRVVPLFMANGRLVLCLGVKAADNFSLAFTPMLKSFTIGLCGTVVYRRCKNPGKLSEDLSI